MFIRWSGDVDPDVRNPYEWLDIFFSHDGKVEFGKPLEK